MAVLAVLVAVGLVLGDCFRNIWLGVISSFPPVDLVVVVVADLF